MLDKARKPYVPIDTCSPGGTWIEERRYNRRRPGAPPSPLSSSTKSSTNAATGARVLCGNWLEEQALEKDMLAIERAQKLHPNPCDTLDSARLVAPAAVAAARPDDGADVDANATHMEALISSGWRPLATLDVISEKKNGHFGGGHSSTPYLTCDVRHPMLRELDSTYRVDYNATSSDVASQRRPELGVRSQLLLHQAMERAKEMKAEREEARIRRTLEAESQQKGCSRSLAPNVSEYRATICDETEVLPVVEALEQDYLSEEPITLYTGNPYTKKIMTVHGKTPVDPQSSSRFGKHTYFSESKYAL